MDYAAQKLKVFKVMDKIITLQMKRAVNIMNVYDTDNWDVFKDKVQIQLKALNDAGNTCTRMLDRIDRVTDLDEKLKQLDKMLEEINNAD